mmetsp:Transcript_2184/g.14503  ORF Transcript_2184/g.14503 Transcript_2184/m.14503 type:complete len:214 (-) Transcript_2184:375-1016(-)
MRLSSLSLSLPRRLAIAAPIRRLKSPTKVSTSEFFTPASSSHRSRDVELARACDDGLLCACWLEGELVPWVPEVPSVCPAEDFQGHCDVAFFSVLGDSAFSAADPCFCLPFLLFCAHSPDNPLAIARSSCPSSVNSTAALSTSASVCGRSFSIAKAARSTLSAATWSASQDSSIAFKAGRRAAVSATKVPDTDATATAQMAMTVPVPMLKEEI